MTDPLTYHEAGVMLVRSALSRETMALAKDAYDWSLAHPSPSGAELPSDSDGTFYQDLANPEAMAPYRQLIYDTEIGDIVASTWDRPEVWFMYEQVFSKHGGTTRRTPWHQDAPYLPVCGGQLMVMWISFEAVAAEHALEFVRGSHHGPLYDGSRFDPNDDTAPIYGEGSFPRLPNIEADRQSWPIVSWATQPGDVILFHPAVLHGGGATQAGAQRRTLSLRFFGEDAVVAWRPGMSRVGAEQEAVDELSLKPDVHPLTRMRRLCDGAPFRDPGFPKIRPRPGTMPP